MAFAPYYDREFDVNVANEKERDVCLLAHDLDPDEVNLQLIRMGHLARKTPETAAHPFFQFTLKVMEMRRANLTQADLWKLTPPESISKLLLEIVNHNVQQEKQKNQRPKKELFDQLDAALGGR